LAFALFGFVGGCVALVRQFAQGDGEVARGSLKTVCARFQFIYIGC
jgi:hypothetical protein